MSIFAKVAGAARLKHAAIEEWPLAQPFVISRGAKTSAAVVVVEVTAGEHTGRGEAVPYARYLETPAATLDTLNSIGTSVAEALRALPPGAARNALDCAVWDLACKTAGQPAYILAATPPPTPVRTCYTISLGTPAEMAAAAAAVPSLPLLKLKLGGKGDDARMHAVRAARADATLLADANEAWTNAQLEPFLQAAADAGFVLVEQPLPAGADGALAETHRVVPVCADESLHVAEDLEALADRYDAINVKLDKAGGLTHALAVQKRARQLGFRIMIGSMVATSLAVAPAILLTPNADWVDLDGPLLLAKDRPDGLTIENGIIEPPSARLWG